MAIVLLRLWLGLLVYNFLSQLSGILTINDFEPYFFIGDRLLLYSDFGSNRE